jgi:Clp amino terminal domain, pathogenicity island component
MVPLLGLTRYTEPARHVIVLAEQQALADGDPAISTGDMLLGLLRADRAVAAGALESLGITAGAVRRQLAAITRPYEDGASSYGISRRITLTRMGMGVLSQTIMALTQTGHAEEGQPRTPQGPYLCTGEMLVALIGVLPESVVPVVPASAPEAVQVLNRLGIDRSTALGPVIERVRRSPADERWPSA